jgi:hypothetical protein
MAAFLLPVALGEMYDDVSVQKNITNQTTEDINGELNATVTNVDTGTNQATIELATDNQTISNTIAVGNNKTYSFDRGDVNVTLDEVKTANGSDHAIATYGYPRDFAFGAGASSLWGLAGLAIVLVVFLAVVRKGQEVM